MKSKMRLYKITKNNKEYYGHFVCLPVPHVKRSETAERKSREIWFRLFTRYQTQASPVFLLLCYYRVVYFRASLHLPFDWNRQFI